MELDEITKELPDEFLDQIAGGMSDLQEQFLHETIIALKNKGCSMQDVVGAFEGLDDPAKKKEVFDYITQNWNLV